MIERTPGQHRNGRRDRVVFALALFVFVWSLTTHGKYSNTGDEPHYLMVTRSLLRDHDLDLSNNYAAPDSLTEPGDHAARARDGSLQSIHDVGLPLLLTPVYAVAEWITASVPPWALSRFRLTSDLLQYSVVSLTMLAAVCLALTWLAAALEHVVSPGLALVVAGVVAVSPPILTESFLVFPESIALIVMCGVVWWLLEPGPAPWTTWTLAAALGYLPWCHRKYALLVMACVTVMLWKRRDLVGGWSGRTRAGLTMLLFCPYAALYWWTWRTWGTAGGPLSAAGAPFTVVGIPRGLAGVLIDRQYGLVADAPVYLLALAAWMLATPSTRPTAWIVGSLLLPVAAYVNWPGGFSPPARYLVPVLPFCALAIAEGLRFRTMRVALAALGSIQLVFTGFAWHHPRSLWPWIDGYNPLLRDLGPVGHWYARFLPMVKGGPTSHVAISAAIVIAFNVLLVWAARRSARASS